MDPTTITTVFAAVNATSLVAMLLARSALAKQERAYQRQIVDAREMEKQLHLRERDFLSERNQLELEHADALRAARAAAFEEGRRLGQTYGNASRVNELTEQRQTLLAKFETERAQAVAEARERLRAEYELQSKLFTVKISPYVSIQENRALIGHKYETVSGYQYQLLVNGIPAFSPHIVAEQTEKKKAINPEVERLLLPYAERAADAAIKLYLGGNSQFAKLAEPILKRLPRRAT